MRRKLRGSSGPDGVRRRTVLLVSVLLPSCVAWGCEFQRRPEARNGGPDGGSERVGAPPSAPTEARDSVGATVAAFQEALEAGDVSRAVGLLTAEATLHDAESGGRWDLSSADSLLPGPLGRGGELRWMSGPTGITVFSDGALVVKRYRANIAGEDAPWTATETYVLLRTEEGWRIHHLHRSRGPAAP